MSSLYHEICGRIETGTEKLKNAKLDREHAAEQALSTLVRIPENDGFDLANALALREFFRAAEAAAATLRDQVPHLVSELDKLNVFFQSPAIPATKPSFWARLTSTNQQRRLKTPEHQVSDVNPQEAFERASHWNTLILKEIGDLVAFVEEMQEKIEDALVEPKAFVIDLVRKMSLLELSEQEARRIGTRKLYAEEAISMAGKHLIELSLLKREFSGVVEQLKKNEIDNAKIEDDIINIFHPNDVEKITGKPILAYAL